MNYYLISCIDREIKTTGPFADMDVAHAAMLDDFFGLEENYDFRADDFSVQDAKTFKEKYEENLISANDSSTDGETFGIGKTGAWANALDNRGYDVNCDWKIITLDNTGKPVK